MRKEVFHEVVQRGVPDFPVEHHHVDSNHPSYRMRLQWHNDLELERVLSGTLMLTLNDQTYTLRPGDSVLIPAGTVHAAQPENCVYECVNFPQTLLDITPKTRELSLALLQNPVFFSNDRVIERIFQLVSAPLPCGEFQILADLFDVIHRAVAAQKDMPAIRGEYRIERIRSAIVYIEAHLSDSITLEQLSKECSMSPGYFCSFFREVTGKTPGEYIATYRTEAASKLLLAGKSVTETAFECGYSDVSYFSSVFKKRTGCSPKQYARKFWQNTQKK